MSPTRFVRGGGFPEGSKEAFKKDRQFMANQVDACAQRTLTVCKRNGSIFCLLACDTETRARIDMVQHERTRAGSGGKTTYRNGACYLKLVEGPGTPVAAEEDQAELDEIRMIWKELAQKWANRAQVHLRLEGLRKNEELFDYAHESELLLNRLMSGELDKRQYEEILRKLTKGVLTVRQQEDNDEDNDEDNEDNEDNHNHNRDNEGDGDNDDNMMDVDVD